MKHLLPGQSKLSFGGGERVLLARTDALGDLMVSLPLQQRLLAHHPGLEIHWLVRPYPAPLLREHPDVAGVHLRSENSDLASVFAEVKPHAVLNLGHRDKAVIVAAQQAGVPVRVARARGLPQILAATHLLWKGRYGSGRHEAMNVLDFLSPWGLAGGAPEAPRLFLTEAERAQGERDLQTFPRPRLGLFFQGSGAGASPSQAWWKTALPVFASAGWAPIPLGPPELSELPATDLRGLLARLAACDAILSPSSGPAHMAAALSRPLLCLMGLRPNHSPDRWAPLGSSVQVLQYPGPEADLAGGMDRLNPADLLPHLDRLRARVRLGQS
ncbi:glycosyltransferase family 9 protein [Geothrix sp. PMB-07]|uniref:glycosyltransferase family 9 protein n=1 Tax=Geothrix sp. PMB-07 TaxID=3068640 RepID=UPI002741CF80|nr:glycosyltransferase family 9 protein [Geothrix sp. PMB-07]WLT30569.1 glycosyltransferase family 9 protein [Geothrix sp. PMB-07]